MYRSIDKNIYIYINKNNKIHICAHSKYFSSSVIVTFARSSRTTSGSTCSICYSMKMYLPEFFNKPFLNLSIHFFYTCNPVIYCFLDFVLARVEPFCMDFLATCTRW